MKPRFALLSGLALLSFINLNAMPLRVIGPESNQVFDHLRGSGAGRPWRQAEDSARKKRWHEDLDVLVKGVAEKAKPLRDDAAKKKKFLDAVVGLDANVTRKTDEEIVVSIMKALAGIGDSHTSLNFDRFGWREYPVRFYWFAEGVYVRETAKGYEQLLGARLLRVNNTSVEDLLKKLDTMIPHENDSAFRAFVPSFLTSVEVLKGMNVVQDPKEARFAFRSDDGKKIDIALGPTNNNIKWVAYPEKQLRYSHPGENYWFQYLAESKTIYLVYRQCSEMQNLPFAQFQQQLLDALDANPLRGLIIDLRDNGGGRSAILDPFIETLAKRNAAGPSVPIYVLIGRGTFSSAGLNAISLKLKAGAIFVGEPSGVKPNHYGELQMLEMPNSHLRIFYSTQYWRPWPSDSDRTLKPDIEIKESWKEFSRGFDPALQAITSSGRPAISRH